MKIRIITDDDATGLEFHTDDERDCWSLFSYTIDGVTKETMVAGITSPAISAHFDELVRLLNLAGRPENAKEMEA